MSDETPKLRILRLHKRWADGYALIWFLFVIVLFGGIFVFFDQSGIAPENRNASLILLGVVVIVIAIWQAAGSTVARIHMLLEGIEPSGTANASTLTSRRSRI